MADTDLIENEIMFTRLCERPSDELRRAGVKLETNTLAYSGLFYVSRYRKKQYGMRDTVQKKRREMER